MFEAGTLYQKNFEMDFTQLDEESLVVYDSESGDTILFDKQESVFFSLLNEPRNLDTLVAKMSELHDVQPGDDVKSDIEEFLTQMIERNVILKV